MSHESGCAMNEKSEKYGYWVGVYKRSPLKDYGISLDRFLTEPWTYITRFGVHDDTFPKLRQVDLTAKRRPAKPPLPRTHHRRAPVISIEDARARRGK